MITTILEESEFYHFMESTVPYLESVGWRVIRDIEVFPLILNETDLEWYSELNDTPAYDYFEFKLGILIDNQKINLVPLIADYLKNHDLKSISKLSPDEKILIDLDDNKKVRIPVERFKPIIQTLTELYDFKTKSIDNITLSKRQASLLTEIEKAFHSSKLRWFGGEKIRSLAQKLSTIEKLKKTLPPKTFKAKLRPYQQEGVNWLQFLREFEFGGILADDMGLGKTVQTLAHLSIEKAQNRLTLPSLIIAPTSLVTNWKLETKNFAPNLKLLTYHGINRHNETENLADYDLIVTTYPLLLRDKDNLLPQDFYYIILDEAQFIKNEKAKVTQIVQQIKAQYRLCITGTPMENHLGELWSLFNFVMPGFLSSSTRFKQVFRTPIEKLDDADARKTLNNRIKPFMIRRTKDNVIKELPAKTEIIIKLEISGHQRDLYESVRMAMESKVRKAIQSKGLNRSHIIILDALLKLRQICCHPKLVKMPSAKKAHKESAKMNWLEETLPNMIEEGKKIILFSQFTSMLTLIESKLNELGIDFVKLCGSTKDRAKPIELFQNGTVPIFLISLKAGGTGLNLTAADTVIHFDPWWNPAVEDQATDRAHRMGQKKPVFIYKILTQDTVEEVIQQMQTKKRSLMQGLLNQDIKQNFKITDQDLQALFRPI